MLNALKTRKDSIKKLTKTIERTNQGCHLVNRGKWRERLSWDITEFWSLRRGGFLEPFWKPASSYFLSGRGVNCSKVWMQCLRRPWLQSVSCLSFGQHLESAVDTDSVIGWSEGTGRLVERYQFLDVLGGHLISAAVCEGRQLVVNPLFHWQPLKST